MTVKLFGILARSRRSRLFVASLGLVAMLLAVCAPLPAQPQECGSVVTEKQVATELESMMKGVILALAPPVDQPYRIPLTIHIVRRSNGTGGFTLAQLAIAMQDLNRDWQPVGIQFFQYGAVDYIDNDTFFTIADSRPARDALRRVNPVANTINIYFTNLTGLCGESTFTTDSPQGVLIDNGCAGIPSNPSTFPHEVGHYFDLYHTHETRFGVECPNESNCSTAGDFLCDTPADPDLTNRVNSSCVYDNSAPIPSSCGTTPYAPQTNNLMSYSVKTCRNFFTPNQISKALSILTSRRTELYPLVKYVDAAAAPSGDGTPQRPFRTVAAAVTAAGDGNVIVIKSGSYSALTITKRVTLSKWDTGGAVTIGN